MGKAENVGKRGKTGTGVLISLNANMDVKKPSLSLSRLELSLFNLRELVLGFFRALFLS